VADLNFQAKEIDDVLEGVTGDGNFRLKIMSDSAGGQTKWLSVTRDQVRGIRYMLTDFPEGDE
jgi:hypothetical protein